MKRLSLILVLMLIAASAPPDSTLVRRVMIYRLWLESQQQEIESMPPLFAHFDTSGVAALLKTGNAHLLIVGDSISSHTVSARIPAGLIREWGVKTAPFVGYVASPTDGVTDNGGRSFKGTSNNQGVFLKPGPGVLITVANVVGTPVWGEVVTEATSGATGIFLETDAGQWRILYAPGDNTEFAGNLGLSTASATADGGAIAAATADDFGIPTNIFPGPHVLQWASGNPNASITIYRSIMENLAAYPQGDWTLGVDVYARGIYFSWSGAFNIKGRSYRGANGVTQVNHNQQSADDEIKAFLNTTPDPDEPFIACGTGAGAPAWRWEALAGDETGQATRMAGALFYRPGVSSGISLDSVSIGGDGIDSALDTDRCSDAHYGEYLAATKRPEATALVVMLWYGQNDAGLSQATFETRLQSCIDRFTTLGAAAGYATVKFILVSTYNTGGAHLSGKRDACYAVATSNSDTACFVNLYDLYTEAHVTTNTSDGIHPTLAFTQEIASDIADEIVSPTVPVVSSLGSFNGASSWILLGFLH